MSHNQRLYWLKTLGFQAETRSCELPDLGTCVWVDGQKGERNVSLWLSARDGSGVIHGVNGPALTWTDLQDWVTNKPEAKKPLAAQRNLFDLDSD